ncbi:Ribosome biogenesis protein NOP53 [Entamoeba marina]
MPRGTPNKHKKIKSCDPFAPKKSSSAVQTKPSDLPYNKENDVRIPQKMKTLMRMMDNGSRSFESALQQKPSKKTQCELDEKFSMKSNKKAQRLMEYKLKKKMKKDEQEIKRLEKQQSNAKKLLDTQ